MFKLDLLEEGVLKNKKVKSLVNYGLKRSKLKKNRNQRFAIKEELHDTPIMIIKNGRTLKTTGTGVLDRSTFSEFRKDIEWEL